MLNVIGTLLLLHYHCYCYVGGSGKKNGLLIGMVLLAVVLVVALIVIGFVVYR